MNTIYIMRCGHVALAKDRFYRPICPLCIGIKEGADQVAREIDEHNMKTELAGRVAWCPYCRSERPSDPNLPMFQYQPSSPNDVYYCGCRGWD